MNSITGWGRRVLVVPAYAAAVVASLVCGAWLPVGAEERPVVGDEPARIADGASPRTACRPGPSGPRRNESGSRTNCGRSTRAILRAGRRRTSTPTWPGRRSARCPPSSIPPTTRTPTRRRRSAGRCSSTRGSPAASRSPAPRATIPTSAGQTDGRRASGIRGRCSRNAPTVRNTAFQKHLFWDGRAASLEDQAKQVLTNPDEMRSGPEHVVTLIESEPGTSGSFATRSATPRSASTAPRTRSPVSSGPWWGVRRGSTAS